MPNNLADKKVLLVVAGYVAVEYLRVLNSLNFPVLLLAEASILLSFSLQKREKNSRFVMIKN